MKATNWEFKNRALVFGLIFTVAFLLYALDHENSTVVLTNWLGTRYGLDADSLARCVFAGAACLLILMALIRGRITGAMETRVRCRILGLGICGGDDCLRDHIKYYDVFCNTLCEFDFILGHIKVASQKINLPASVRNSFEELYASTIRSPQHGH